MSGTTTAPALPGDVELPEQHLHGTLAEGMSSYLVGRLIPGDYTGKGISLAKRYGTPALLLSWVPLIGDALCVAAGWLRLQPALAAFFLGAGKLARYIAVAWLVI